MRNLKKISRPFDSIFTKLAVAFLIVGLLPLLIISRFFFVEFSGNAEQILLDDAKVVLKSSSGYVDTMLEGWENKTKELYSLDIGEGLFLGDVLLDKTMSSGQKNEYVRKFLNNIGSENGIRSIRFLDLEGNLYYVSETVGKVINVKEMEKWKNDEIKERTSEHQITVTPMHKDVYFSNINDDVVTVKRNLFDITSVKTVENCIGTIYLDISQDIMAAQLSEINLGSRSGFYIIDKDGEEIYKSATQKSIEKEERLSLIRTWEKSGKYQEDSTSYYLCQENINRNWYSVIRVHKSDIVDNVKQTQHFIITILLASSGILLLFYMLFSARITAPIQKLKDSMQRIQEGNLDTRVDIKSQDEIGVLAKGLNQMAEQLEQYIERIYGAEIKQKDAELNALKSQIKPHYLYNTLDVIRMTAIQNDDKQTAQMIECLARQLRYLIGNEKDTVKFADELNNIEDYFTLIRVRYEKRVELKVNISETMRQLPILKLLLQPIVENAVKHGLKPKAGTGTIWISGKKVENVLEITVMDDGVGMDDYTVAHLKKKLADGQKKEQDGQSGGIGLCNVQERIQKNYGKDYGVEIQSTKNVGTIVILRIPYGRQ